jgi:hypothetical protein
MDICFPERTLTVEEKEMAFCWTVNTFCSNYQDVIRPKWKLSSEMECCLLEGKVAQTIDMFLKYHFFFMEFLSILPSAPHTLYIYVLAIKTWEEEIHQPTRNLLARIGCCVSQYFCPYKVFSPCL